jgi:hypothetical protein
MQEIPRFCRLGTVYFVLLFVAAGISQLEAQNGLRNGPVKAGSPEELTQTELLEAYRNMREQLRATQTSIVNNRFEAEATARDQATATAEKIQAMNAILAAERKNRQAESDRFEFVHDQEQAEIRRSNRSVVWVASAFGTVGLLTMLLAAIFQWRAINRMAEVVEQRIQSRGTGEYGLLPDSNSMVSGQIVALSTQRLVSAVDRMEQRIKELEHIAIQPAPIKQPAPAKTHDAVV